ncbi:hypothetical protein B566_EDAN004942 [Ephemera danica]|nr:hypothetical protein B566_EDAN004942 [Ephemera danica]
MSKKSSFEIKSAAVQQLEQVAAWRFLNFPNADPRDSVATGLTVTPDRFFISMPRLRENAPVTLAWTPRTLHETVDAELIPFPDISWQYGHRDNCTGLVSVFRTRLDRCGRLWVLDSGTVNTSTRVCPARLFVFDPHSGIPLHVFTVPPQVLRDTSVLPYFEFEYALTPHCESMHVYISDALGYGLIVLDAMRDTFWRFEHPTFRNEPQLGDWEVAGERANTQDGIVGLAVVNVNGHNMLFYRPFASLSIYSVSTEALRIPTAGNDLPVFRVLEVSSQGVSMAAHGSRILFNPVRETNVVQYDANTLRVTELVREPLALQFVVDMKVEPTGDIWLLSNRFQKFAANTYNPNEINLRILRIPGGVMLLLLLLSVDVSIQSVLQTIAGWPYLRFPTNDYTPENCITTGITVAPDRFVLAVPRFRAGVPTTIAWMPRTYWPQHDPLLLPFPSHEWQRGHQDGCHGIVSVFRTRLDSCNRLWTVDSGWYNGTKVCPPKLLVFELQTGRLVRRFTFPSQVLRPESLLTFFVLDYTTHQDCDPEYVYITDAIGYGLVVYDVAHNKTWRVEHETFRHDPKFANLTVAGETTTTDDGIIALALGRIGTERVIFYHALAGLNVYALPTDAIRTPSSPGDSLPVIQVLEKSSPGVGMTTDCKFPHHVETSCRLFVSPAAETAVDTWSPHTGQLRRIASDPWRLQYISDMVVAEDALWLVSNRFQSFDNGTYDPHGINLRVLRLSLS